MQPIHDALVYIVDDDASVREALAWLLRSRRLASESFESGDAFLARLQAGFDPTQPCCLLLDVRMPGTSGLALFDGLLARRLVEVMPVIFLTGHADVPTAVDMVKRGAFDFCEKPFSDNALVDRIEQALAQSARVQSERRERDRQPRHMRAGNERQPHAALLSPCTPPIIRPSRSGVASATGIASESRPSFSTAIRSDSANSSSRSCEMTSTAVPASAR